MIEEAAVELRPNDGGDDQEDNVIYCVYYDSAGDLCLHLLEVNQREKRMKQREIIEGHKLSDTIVDSMRSQLTFFHDVFSEWLFLTSQEALAASREKRQS